MQKNQGLTMEKRAVWVSVSGGSGCWREEMNTVGGWWVLEKECECYRRWWMLERGWGRDKSTGH